MIVLIIIIVLVYEEYMVVEKLIPNLDPYHQFLEDFYVLFVPQKNKICNGCKLDM